MIMEKIIFIVEKTNTGYSAYAKDDKYPFGTTGYTMEELKENMIDAANAWFEYKKMPLIGADEIAIKIDLPQFFDYYKEINASALSKRIKMDRSLLSQYKTGEKQPSEKQMQKILSGIKSLGQELSALEFA
jgi:transcriptional regulator with XRE-family HTH domain